jgi:Type VI secretion system VasI, EvfG, VC_A0118
MSMKVLAGMGLGCLALLWVLGRIKSAETASAPDSVSSQRSDGWNIRESRSPMDDSRIVTLSLKAQNMIRGPLGEKRPTLILRCQAKTTDIYVVTEMAANIEENSDGGPEVTRTVGIRLDDQPARHEGWLESTDHTALFAEASIFNTRNVVEYPSGPLVPLAKEIAKAKTLTFQFTPFDGSPQIAKFDLRGIDSHVGKLAEACGWPME